MELEDFSSFISEFIEEAEEHLQTLTSCLLELEKSGIEDFPKERIDSLFRAAHTIKGLAGMMEFEKIENLCHNMEEILGEIRQGAMPLTQPVVDAFFIAIDMLTKQLESVKTNNNDQEIDPAEVIATLTKILEDNKENPAGSDEVVTEVGFVETLNEIDDSLLTEFVDGTTELLDSLDLELLELDRRPASTEVIRKIPKTLARLKNSAEMYNFKNISLLAESLENLFGEILKKQFKPDHEILETVFDSMEKFKQLLDEIRNRKDTGKSINSDLGKIKGLHARMALDKTAPEIKTEETVEEMPDRKTGTETPTVKNMEIKEGSKEKVEKKIRDKGISTIRVEIERLDKLLNHVGELVIDRIRFEETGAEMKKRSPHDPISIQLTETNQLFQRHLNEIQSLVMSVRMVPISNVFNRFPRIMRDLAKTLGKRVNFIVSGGETELDKTLVEEISEPLMHLLRNSLGHGIETPDERAEAGKNEEGTVKLKAYHQGDSIIIEIDDDGRGMDVENIRQKGIELGLISDGEPLTEKEIIQTIFEPGFSTTDVATKVSGRGVGMDVVKQSITRLKGLIDLDSRQGEGLKIVIRLPLTLAIVPTLIIGARDETYAIPLSSVIESIRVNPEEINKVQGKEMITLRDNILPLVRLDDLFELDRKKNKFRKISPPEAPTNGKGKKSVFIVVLGIAEKRLGLIVKNLKTQQEVVIKNLSHLLGDVPGISGATIMGNGKVCLILDIGEIVDEALKRGRIGRTAPQDASNR